MRRRLTASAFSNALKFQTKLLSNFTLMQNLSACRRLRRMKFCRPSQAARGICLSCMRVTAQRGFFVSVVRFAYRVYASWTSIRLPRAVAARPPRYAYFCAVNRTSAASASRSRRAFKARKSILHKISLLRCARLLPHFVVLVCYEPSPHHIPAHIRAVPAASFSARALKFWSKSLI